MTPRPPAQLPKPHGAHRRRSRGLAAVATAVLATTAATACLPEPTPSPSTDTPAAGNTPALPADPADAKPKLVKYGQDIPYPDQVAAAPQTYASLPFDGIVLRVSASADIFSPRAVDQDELLEDVSELPTDLGGLRENWVRISLHDELDWADDELWATIADNSEKLASALRRSGRPYVGIWFDNEFYGEGDSPWNYGQSHDAWEESDTEGAMPGVPPEEAREQARRRGAQVMQAMARGWPDLAVIVLFGPWISEPATTTALSGAGLHWNDISWANELSGPFFMGMVETAASAPPARVIDGGEYYDARSAEDYRAFRAWQDRGFLENATSPPDPITADAYDEAVTSALAVYDRDQTDDFRVQDAETIGELTRIALEETEEYAWLYTEEHEWAPSESGKPPVPQEYVDAVADARDDTQ